jgi:HD-like signal output (HDOD) protein
MKSKRAVDVDELRRLAIFADSAAAELRHAAGNARRLTFDGERLSRSSDTDGLDFLVAGRLRVNTLHKASILLDANDPAATYPLPALDTLQSIEVVAPATLLRVPREYLKRHVQPEPVAPRMTPLESEAFDDLRAHFDSAHHELPNLPDLAMKIGNAINDRNTSNDDVARLIQLDPVLSTRVLSVVNSAAFGGVSRVSSIPQATARLGRRKVRSLVFSCMLKSVFKVEAPLLRQHMRSVWQRSTHVAALSYVLARATPGIDAEQALLAGLLHDIGSIAVIGGVAHFPQLAEREEVFDYVMAKLRTDSGKRILSHWRLEAEFGDVVGRDDWQRMGSAIAEVADVVLIARLHAAIGKPDQRDLPFIDAVPAFAKLANGELSPRRSLAALDRANAEVAEVQALLNG